MQKHTYTVKKGEKEETIPRINCIVDRPFDVIKSKKTGKMQTPPWIPNDKSR